MTKSWFLVLSVLLSFTVSSSLLGMGTSQISTSSSSHDIKQAMLTDDVVLPAIDTSSPSALYASLGQLAARDPLLRHKLVRELAFILQRMRIDLNTLVDAEGNTPLHVAVENGDWIVVDILLGANARVAIANEYGLTPMHVAVINKHVDILRRLLSYDSDHKAVDIEDISNHTCLYYAADSKHVLMTDMLCKAGAKLVFDPECLYAMLHQAVSCGDEKVVELILQKDTDHKVVNTVSEFGFNSLHSLLYDGVMIEESTLLAIVKQLVAGGVNLLQVDYMGRIPLHWAVYFGKVAVVEYLLNLPLNDDEFNVMINAQDKDGFTPLHLAVFFNRNDLACMLVFAGADWQLVDSYNRTVCMLAEQCGNTLMAEMLKGFDTTNLIDIGF